MLGDGWIRHTWTVYETAHVTHVAEAAEAALEANGFKGKLLEKRKDAAAEQARQAFTKCNRAQYNWERSTNPRPPAWQKIVFGLNDKDNIEVNKKQDSAQKQPRRRYSKKRAETVEPFVGNLVPKEDACSTEQKTIHIQSKDKKESRKVGIAQGTSLTKLAREVQTHFAAFAKCETFIDSATQETIKSINEMVMGGSYVFCFLSPMDQGGVDIEIGGGAETRGIPWYVPGTGALAIWRRHFSRPPPQTNPSQNQSNPSKSPQMTPIPKPYHPTSYDGECPRRTKRAKLSINISRLGMDDRISLDIVFFNNYLLF